MKKYISRTYVIFDSEDPRIYALRIDHAIKMRSRAYNNIKTL